MAWLSADALLARRYRLVERIGLGGMSVVWRAHDEVLDRVVAVKVLAAELAADPRFRALVRDEARAAAKLVHPHITAIHDYGEVITAEGTVTAFVVMELLTGEELETRLAAGPLPWPEAVRICAEVAEALAAAHRQGIVHRDITPSNIMLTRGGAKVLDFGIATRIGAPDEDEDGGTFGTPSYVAPERLNGTPAQPATDIYSLGVLLYETLTGQVPFPADTWEELTHVLANGSSPASIDRPGIPATVGDICFRALTRDPEQRPTAQQVAETLRAALTGAAGTVGSAPPGPTTAAPDPEPRVPHEMTAVAAPPTEPRTRRAVAVTVLTLVALAVGALASTALGGREPKQPPTVIGEGEATPPASGGGTPGAPITGVPARAEDPVGTVPSAGATPPVPAAPAESASPGPTGPNPTGPGPTSPTPPVEERTPGFGEVLVEIDNLIDDGLRAGEIRDDAGVDLRNHLDHVYAALVDQRADTIRPIEALRRKVAVRANEGAITRPCAARLDEALHRLTNAI
jgi:hypothetical protein